jgi:phytoene dehydrogenase-like protein
VPPPDRVVIIGAGHNGLVAAFYLAKAGFAPLVLERREDVGGGAVTERLHPGFQCPSLDHTLGPFLPKLTGDIRLKQYGFETILPEVNIVAPDRDGRALVLYQDKDRTAREIERLSVRDARSYLEFQASFANIGRVLAPLSLRTPPNIHGLAWHEMWSLGKMGLSFRKLSRKDAFRLLRWGPMAVADLAAEWFETELLRAIVAAGGIHGAFAGPWSAGTSIPLLMLAARTGQAIAPTVFAKGGTGALTRALQKAAASAGAEIRTSARVMRIRVKAGRVSAVALDSGEEISARAVVSNADPRQTFLDLVDPMDLDPAFLQKVRNYRATAAVAKVNLALSGLPSFSALKQPADRELAGRIHIGSTIDYLERAFDAAKYGRYSAEPYMDITIPSVTDSSLAPRGAHVMSIHVQYAPYQLKAGDWKVHREAFGDLVVKTLSEYAPRLPQLVVARQVITPADLEQRYGLSGGHIHHGDLTLDQVFAFRPILGWAQYRTPIQGLYLCGAGTHPGGGLTGGPGANASREIIHDLKK